MVLWVLFVGFLLLEDGIVGMSVFLSYMSLGCMRDFGVEIAPLCTLLGTLFKTVT